MSRKMTEERILRRIEGEGSLIQERIQKLENRTNHLPEILRKILVLKEEYSRTRKSIKKEFKILDRELSSYIDFLEEDVPSKGQEFQENLKELIDQLSGLKTFLKEKENRFSRSLEDLPPDIVP